MVQGPDEITVLREVHKQLSESCRALELNPEYRAVFLHILEQSRGQTTNQIAERVLAAFANQQPSLAVTLDAQDASDLLQEIAPIIRAARNALIAVIEYRTRMNDIELCTIIYAQLQQRNNITLPETEVFQLVELLNRSAQQFPDIQVFFAVGECIKQLKRHSATSHGETIWRIDLPDSVANEFLEILEQAQASSGSPIQ